MPHLMIIQPSSNYKFSINSCKINFSISLSNLIGVDVE